MDSHRRVLIVEDNPDGRLSLRLLLEAFGHEVQVASDGPEGVRRALKWRPDAAVVDIGLPILDGYEVARRVRSALGRDVMLLAVTAYSQPEDRRKALEAGFDAHLTKPAEPARLRDLLARAPAAKRERGNSAARASGRCNAPHITGPTDPKSTAG